MALLVARLRISENGRNLFGNFRDLYGIDHLLKRKGKIGRGRSRLRAGSPMRYSIPGLQDHAPG